MAYSFAKSVRENYEMNRDTGSNNHLGGSQNESRHDSGHEYLDLGFAWLNDYDKDGNLQASDNHPRDIGDTQNDTIYIRTTQGARQQRKRSQSRSREGDALRHSRQADIRETAGEDGLRLTRKRAIRHARRQSHRSFENNDIPVSSTSGRMQTLEDDPRKTNVDKFRATMQHNYEDENRNVSSSMARDFELKPTNLRESTDRETESSNLRGMTSLGVSLHPRKFDERDEENPYGWKALGATRHPTPKTPNFAIDETDEENPYGWKALGATRNPTPKTKNFAIDETDEENPYGWKALGATRNPTPKTKNFAIDETDEENPYGWKALGATRNPTPKTQNFANDETVEENPYGWKALGATRHPTSKTPNFHIDETVKENHYGWKALSATRNSSPKTQNFANDETVEENPYEWKALGATRHTSHKPKNLPFDETVEENPYGWKALGATRHPTFASDSRNIQINETIEGNPFGWKNLGATQHLPSNNSDYGITNSTSRKRSRGQTSRSNNRSHSSGREVLRPSHNSGRRIARARRMQAVPEESIRNEDVVDSQPIDANVVIRNTTGNRQLLRATSGGEGLRRTTYDYAYTRNIKRDSIPERIPREPVNAPARQKISWAKQSSPELRVKRWTDIATDYSAMRKWYEMFVKIKKRWAADYKNLSLLSGLSGSTDFRPGTFTSRSVHKKRQLSGRRRHALICAIVFVVLLIAVVVPVAMLTSGHSQKGQQFLFDLEVIINETYTDEMSDNTTEEFRFIAQSFCYQIDTLGKNIISFKYIGCRVTSLSNGSVIVFWQLALETDDETVPTNVTILNEFRLKEQNVLGPFQIVGPSKVLSDRLVREEELDIFKRRNFNEKCSAGQLCAPIFSDCINMTCACPDNRVNEASTNVCSIISCGVIPDIANGTISANDTNFGGVLTIACDTGFEISANNTIQCSSPSSWTTPPSCNIIQCEDYVVPEHADLGSITRQNLTFLDEIIIACEEGFEIIGENKTICQENKTWSINPICQPVNCSAPVFQENIIMVTENNTYVFGSTIEVACVSGYTIDGGGNITCQANKSWTESPNCVPVSCPDFQFPENAETQNVTDTNLFNNSIKISCLTGFVLDGNNSVFCQENGNWTELPNCNPVNCPLFNKPENSVDFNESETFKYLDMVTIDCEVGYRLSSNKSITCNGDGKWSLIPECIKVQCDVYERKNGKAGNQTFYSENISLECDLGYENSSNETVTCLLDGQWSSNVTCEIVDCLEYMPPEHASVTNNSNTTVYGTIIELTCESGFVLKNESSVSCSAEGVWEGKPECELGP